MRNKVAKRLRRQATATAEQRGSSIQTVYNSWYPPIYNKDKKVTAGVPATMGECTRSIYQTFKTNYMSGGG